MNALTPATYASICCSRPRRRRGPRRSRGAAEADRAQEPILRHGRLAEDLRQPAEADAPLELHLPQPILRVDVAQAEQRIALVAAKMCGMASASRTISTGADSPATSDRAVRRPAAIGARTDRPRPASRRRGPASTSAASRFQQHRRMRACIHRTPSLRRSSADLRIEPGVQSCADDSDELEAVLDRLYDGIQLSRFGDRSDPDRPALPAGRRPRGRRRSSRRRSPSAASPACCSRSSVCWRSSGREPAAYVRALRSAPPDAGVRRLRPPLDARSDLVALLWILRADVRSLGIDRRLLPRRDTTRRRPTSTAALDSFSTRALALDVTAAYGRVRRTRRGRASATSFRGRRPAAAASG